MKIPTEGPFRCAETHIMRKNLSSSNSDNHSNTKNATNKSHEIYITAVLDVPCRSVLN